MVKTKEQSTGVSSAITRSDCSIRPFVSGKPNFGLEKHGLVVADGIKHRDGVAVIGAGRVKTYITGLNEGAPEIQGIVDVEEREAAIKEIRKIVARAENELNANFTVDPDNIDLADKTFWDRVTMFKSVVPDKFDEQNKRITCYWDEIVVDMDNHGQVLDKRLITDLLLIKVIEAGGISLIAPSYEVAVEKKHYKFYLDKREATSKVKVSPKILRDEAGAELLKLYKGDSNKLCYVTKLISMDSLVFKIGKNMTPIEVFYDECSKYIDGTGMEKDKVKACETFLKCCKMTMADLKLQCIVNDSKVLRLVSYKPDGSIYHLKSSTPMGKTVPECVKFLDDPLNQDVYKDLLAACEKEWAG